MSSLSDTDHALSFNLLLCRDLLMTVNIPVHKKGILLVGLMLVQRGQHAST